MPSPSSRAMGALLGQVVGDALGSQLEFKSAASIRKGSMDILASRMLGSPVWGTIPGQITDDRIDTIDTVNTNRGLRPPLPFWAAMPNPRSAAISRIPLADSRRRKSESACSAREDRGLGLEAIAPVYRDGARGQAGPVKCLRSPAQQAWYSRCR